VASPIVDEGMRGYYDQRAFFTGDGLARELGGGEILHDGGWCVAVVVR
jgi:hypothetical protein